MLRRLLKSEAKQNFRYFIKWTMYAILSGLVIGCVGSVFRRGVDFATKNWSTHPECILLSPLAGVLIVGLTKLLKEEKNGGTNTVIDSITEGKHITVRTAPLIFTSTILSHLTGASVGKEGAALMVGGSLGELFSRLLRFDEKDQKIAIMCGMSACFAAIFETPMAAAIFPMEMISIGIMYYAALIPCIFAAFLGAGVSAYFGNQPEQFPVTNPLPFTIPAAATAVCFGALCAGVAILFSIALYRGHRYTNRLLPNPWMRVIAGGVLLILMTGVNRMYFSGGYDFNGGGFFLMEKAFAGEAPWYAFAFKLIFTCICIWAGFKGGEIVPTLCIGACFGSLFAVLTGQSAALYMACGTVALFVGMTNCPFSSLLMAFELFGYEAMPYFAVVIAVSFTLSGYYGLYSSQKFPYSKTRAVFINRKGPRKYWKK